MDTNSDGSLVHSCTATLISSNVLLTAASELEQQCRWQLWFIFLLLVLFVPACTDAFLCPTSWSCCFSVHSTAHRPRDPQGCFTDFNNGDGFIVRNKEVIVNLYSYDEIPKIMSSPMCTIEGGGCLEPYTAYAIRHSDFNKGAPFSHDFALIFLPFPPISDIGPVALNSDIGLPTFNGKDVTAIGWGVTGTDQTESTRVPHTLIMTPVDSEGCQALSPEGTSIVDSMLCAIGGGTTSTFNGDTGV